MNDIIKKFNEISIDFLTQTTNLVGKTYLYKYKLMHKVNKIYAIDMFILKVLPFKNRILDKDETFFINKDIDSDYSNYIEDFICMKQIYSKMDQNSKENIWDIVLALVFLAEERYNLKNNIKKHHNKTNHEISS
jgi:hypothetical protein